MGMHKLLSLGRRPPGDTIAGLMFLTGLAAVEGDVTSGTGSETGGALFVSGGRRLPRETRLVALRANRLVMVAPQTIRFAEVDGNDVWLTTDHGRVRARGRGLERLEHELAGGRFLRVHRRYVVNLDRVREIEPAFKGALWLVMDAGPRREVVPVSRRRAAQLRRALGV
jgi:sigma-54 dependent transcriptional regulator, acetoin dehydrogenase operon transcriptional activator AcoR